MKGPQFKALHVITTTEHCVILFARPAAVLIPMSLFACTGYCDPPPHTHPLTPHTHTHPPHTHHTQPVICIEAFFALRRNWKEKFACQPNLPYLLALLFVAILRNTHAYLSTKDCRGAHPIFNLFLGLRLCHTSLHSCLWQSYENKHAHYAMLIWASSKW
jgi:hypothetical protein